MPTLPEKIRSVLGRRDGVSEEAMRSLATSYDSEVVRINDRLEKIVVLLHKGLRSEAIQLANMTPNVIDAAAALDFPEFYDWQEILQFLGIPVPTELNRDAVDQLSEAIVDTQPLENLLVQHRRLAIARAPLSWRLKVLRRIADLDPANVVWEEDLETWETTRLRQIQQEAQKALADLDIPQLQSLHGELAGVAWRIAPKPSLIQEVSGAVKQYERQQHRETMLQIAHDLNSAFCEFDEERAREQLAAWQQGLPGLGNQVDDELKELVEPASAWLAEMDREREQQAERARAVGRLDSLLDRGEGRIQLEAAYNQCLRFDEPIPQELMARYRSALLRYDQAAKRRNQAIILSIVSLVLLVAGSLVYWIHRSGIEKEIALAESQLSAMIGEGRHLDARDFADQLVASESHVVKDARVTSLFSKLKGIEDTEQQRVVELQGYRDAANVESPGKMDYQALAKAESLAVTEEEKSAAFRIRQKYNQWEKDEQQRHTTELAKELEAARDRLDQLEATNPVDVSEGSFAPLITNLNELQSRYPRASSAIRSQISAVVARARAMQSAIHDKVERMRQEQATLSQILLASTLEALEVALKQYPSRASNSPYAAEYERTATEKSHWMRPSEWNRYASFINGSLSPSMSNATVTKILQTHEAYEALMGRNLAFDDCKSFRTQMAELAKRKTLYDANLGQINSAVIAELYTVIERQGEGNRYFIYKTYYDRSGTNKMQSEKVGLEVVVNDSGAVANSALLAGPFKMIEEPNATIDWLNQVYRDSESEFLGDWEGAYLKTIAQLAKRPGLDAIHKESLMQHLLQAACDGSQLLAGEVSDELQTLKSRARERTNWSDPRPFTDQLSESTRSTVLPKLASVWGKRQTLAAAAKKFTNRRYTWVGCLYRDSTGKATVSMREKPQTNGLLVIARPGLEDRSKTDLVKVGLWKGGEATLTENQSEWTAGRPIFLLTP